ncbi:MAG: tetratricopeptide repeat protein [Acidobacteriota bacterium]
MKRTVFAALIFLLTTPTGVLSTQAQETDGETSGAVPIPSVDLDALEQDVADQIRAQRREVEEVLHHPRATNLRKANAYGDMGRVFHAYALAEAAEACYRNALRFAPEDFRWPYYLGYLLQHKSRLEEAITFYRRALELLPVSIAAQVHLGEIYLALNRPEEAKKFFQGALDVGPKEPAALAGLGQVALSQKRYNDAAGHLGDALERVPQARMLHYPLALAYRGLGDEDKARWHLARRGEVGVRPPDPLIKELEAFRSGERVHLLSGRAAFRAGQFEDAIAGFRKAVAAKPDSARARINLATALSAAGQAEEAEKELRIVIRVAPENPTARYNLGALLIARNALPEALEQLQKAVRLAPEDAAARLDLAETLERSDRSAEALPHFEAAREQSPGEVRAWVGSARIHAENENWQATRDLLEEGHRLLPEDGRLAHALARLLAGSPDRSLRDGEQALDLARRVFEAKAVPAHAATLALALAEQGRCDEAAKWQQRAVDEGLASDAARTALALYSSGPPCRPPGE